MNSQEVTLTTIKCKKKIFLIQRYRLYVLHHLKNLKNLDSKKVDEMERKEANKRGQYCKVVTPDYQKLNSQVKEEINTNGEELKPSKTDGNSTYFSYTKQVYTGKNSEGNRFIKNDDL
jgi:leucine-rich melanocyte differentiation-associated protein